jgi:hypothetical protein
MINTLEQDVRECVQRGYDWLLINGPKRDLLLSRVNPETLEVDTVHACVMAQAAGADYGVGMMRVVDELPGGRKGHTVNGQPTFAWAKSHGFLSLDDDTGGEITNRIWRELLTQGSVA